MSLTFGVFDHIDSDGLSDDPVPLKVTVTVRGSESGSVFGSPGGVI